MPFTRDNLNKERLKVKAWVKEDGLARVLSHNTDFKTKSLTDIFKHLLLIKGSSTRKTAQSDIVYTYQGFPGGSSGKEPTLQCSSCGFDSWVGKIPWRKEWQPTPVFLPGEFHGQRSLVGYSPWGCKESDMTEAT